MEAECLLQYSQEQPVSVLSQIDPVYATSPPPLPISRKIRFNSILPYSLGLQSGLFSSGFPTKTLYAPLLSPYVLHVLPISFFLIWSPE
jgi:hypothetical protein